MFGTWRPLVPSAILQLVEPGSLKMANGSPLRLFRDPIEHAPCVMLGWHAYKLALA